MEIQFRSDLGELLKHYEMLDQGAEIGVAEGRYSLEMMQWGLKKLYLVDLWQHTEQAGDAANSQEWHNSNLDGVKDRLKDHMDKVVLLQGFSKDMSDQVPDESLGFVYLDGDHSYEGVMTDLLAWLPKLKQGGIMAGHDFLSPEYGVERAVKQFTKGRFELHTIAERARENAGFWFQKT